MKNEIRLSNESAELLIIRHCLEKALGFIYCLLKPLLWILKKIATEAFYIWNVLYEIIYSKRKYLNKVLLRILALVEAVILIIFLIRYFYNHLFVKSLLWWMGGIAGGFVGIYLILILYYLLIGRDILYHQYAMLTEKYAEIGLPQNVKYCGPRRVGKDTTSISFTSIIVRMFKRKIKEALRRIRKICYIFDFERVHLCLSNDYYAKYFYQPSEKKREEDFINICLMPRWHAFLTDRALKDIDYKHLIEEYRESLSNKVDFKSKYMFNDGVEKEHFLGLLNEYMFLYVRLYIVKNFVVSNQPILEDPETGLMSKVYSVYYEAIANKKDVSRLELMPDGSKVNVIYEETTTAPLLDWTVSNRTEDDTWLNNMDGEVKTMIEDHKLRDSKAFLFHRYKKFYCFSQCHDAQRTNKQMRELDAFYFTVIQRLEIPGARKRNAVLSFFQKRIDSYVENKQVKYDMSTSEVIHKNQKQLDYLNRLYLATMNDKYLSRIYKLLEKERRPQGRLVLKLAELNKYLVEKIAWNAREHGLIRITATISDQPVATNIKETTIRELVNRERPLFHESYKVEFYFKMKDSMGRYNSNYMADIFENRALKSRLDMMHVLNWDKRMELNRDIMLQMGFPAGHKLYGITPEEVFNFRFAPQQNK